MKRPLTDAELDSLLERGGLGATRRDDILTKVLATVAAQRPPRWRRLWALPAFGMAAAALLLLVPQLSPRGLSPFRAKGTRARPAVTPPALHVECLGATPEDCPLGSLVVLSADGVRGFLSAWAEPAGGGERIWYFSAEGSSPFLDNTSASSAAGTRAVKIGPEHSVGKYVVQARVTARPMARDELLHLPASAALANWQSSITVTKP